MISSIDCQSSRSRTSPLWMRAMSSRLVTMSAMRRDFSPRLVASSSCPALSRGSTDRQHLGRAHQRRQRRAQVVRQRREQRVAQALGLHLDGGALRHLDVVHALQRHGRQRRKGLQLLPLLGDQQEARLAGLHGKHAARAHRRLQRQVEPGTAGKRVRSQARRPGCDPASTARSRSPGHPGPTRVAADGPSCPARRSRPWRGTRGR